MKHLKWLQILTAILLLTAFAALPACSKDNTTAQTEGQAVPASETQPEAGPTTAPEPEIDEVVVSVGTEEPAAEPSEGPVETPAAEPVAEPTETPASEPALVPEHPLADGQYLVYLESTQPIDRDGTVWASFVLLHYVELTDDEISALHVGDTVALPEYSFVIENMQQDTGVGNEREILFNDGTERCFYIEDTKVWRFTWPSDEPYLREGEHGMMPLAIDVILTDELTPQTEGKNVYGMPAGDDPTIGALDLLSDFFGHYPGLEREQAILTVLNEEITEVLMVYHP